LESYEFDADLPPIWWAIVEDQDSSVPAADYTFQIRRGYYDGSDLLWVIPNPVEDEFSTANGNQAWLTLEGLSDECYVFGGICVQALGTNDRIRRLDDYDDDPVANSFIDSRLQAYSQLANDNTAEATYKIEFFQNGSPVSLSNLNAHFYDIDGKQFFEIDNVSGYELTDDTILTATETGPGQIEFRDEEGVSADPDPDEDQVHSDGPARATVNFAPTSSLTFTFGVRGSGSFQADFSAGRAWAGEVVLTGSPRQEDIPATTSQPTGTPTATLPRTGDNSIGLLSVAATFFTAGLVLFGLSRSKRFSRSHGAKTHSRRIS
jgi:hypothetical protein